MSRQGDIRICVQIDFGAGAGGESRAIRFADHASNHHLGWIEYADDGLAAIELIALLGMAVGVASIEILMRHHTRQGCVNLKAVDIRLGAIHCYFLPVPLELQNPESRRVRSIVKSV